MSHLTIATACSQTPEWEELFELTTENKVEYCNKWGASLVAREHSKHQDLMIDRVSLWVEWLGNINEGDWMWFMGADTLIMNMQRDWWFTVGKDENLDFAITRDLFGYNNDSFFIRRSNSTLAFLLEIHHRLSHKFWSHLGTDQSVMSDLLNSNELEIQYKIFPQRDFNSYLMPLYDSESTRIAQKAFPAVDGNYARGDFVLHMPGLSNEVRLALTKLYLTKVVR